MVLYSKAMVLYAMVLYAILLQERTI